MKIHYRESLLLVIISLLVFGLFIRSKRDKNVVPFGGSEITNIYRMDVDGYILCKDVDKEIFKLIPK